MPQLEHGRPSPVITTPYARFYPIYEFHTRPISEPSQLPIPAPHAHFYENASPSYTVVSSTAQENLSGNMWYGNTRTATPFYPPEILEHYATTGTAIAQEGFSVTEADMVASRFLSGIPYASFILAAYLYNRSHDAKIGADSLISRRDAIQLSALAAWATWLLASGTSYLANTVRAYNQESPLPVLHEIQIANAAAGPLDNTVFLRSAIMAARLFTLESYYYWQGIYPNIIYQVGAGHQVLELFINLGPKAVYEIISYYPHAYIQALMDLNGGPRVASSLVITPVKENLHTHANRQTILVNPNLLQIFQSKMP